MRFSFLHSLSFLLLLLLPLSGCLEAESIETIDTANKANVEHEAEELSTPLHLSVALEYEGVTEVAHNTGPEIDQFLANVGLESGLNYCAAFVSYVLDKADVTMPTVRSGVAQHFITDQSISAKEVLRGTATIPKGDILVWKRGNTWQGHTGFTLEDWSGPDGITIEANTSPGVRASPGDSQGVHVKERTIQPGNYFRITHFTPVKYS